MISNFLLHYNICDTKSIWISRHGESQDNLTGILGGDSSITDKGKLFGSALEKFVNNHDQLKDSPVFTSTLKRTRETANYLGSHHHIYNFCNLNELNAGICERMTYKQIEENLPQEFEARKLDKLRYRYPMGESYVDIILRVHPFALELERETRTVLVISHQALLRTILGYFIHAPLCQLPYLEIPLHTIIQLKRSNLGCHEIRYKFDLDRFQQGDEEFWTKEHTFHSLV